jgi:hypothetical protein
MKTSKVHVSILVVPAVLAFGACRGAPDDDARADERAQDSAWGYQRDSAAAAHFLVQNGKGSLAETNAYYAQTVETFSAAATYTLATWQSQYLTGPTVAALYRNRTELGFWRDMTCTQTIHRGVGGCAVTNYKNETDKAQHQANLGTVAMNVSPDGFARFYVFLPNGTLSPSALLDSEGPKFLPRLCTVCHGGHPAAPDTQPDLGSIFREFMPSQLQAQTGLARPDAEAQWFALNQAIRTANQSIRGEAEGAPAGVDHAKAAMSALLDQLYPDLAPPARSLIDPAITPVSWTCDPKNTKLWTSLVAPYCMGCHRHNADDWSVYGNFEYLSEASDDGVALRDYIGGGATSAHPQPFMPQSELQYNLLTADHGAQSAVDAWLPCLGGQACVPANPCHKGVNICTQGVAPTCGDTGRAVPDGTACGDHGTCSHGACTSTSACNPKVLLLSHPSSSSDTAVDAMAQGLGQLGLDVVVSEDGAANYIGTPSTDGVGAILFAPEFAQNQSASDGFIDTPTAGQQAIVAANARGIGVVFTESLSYPATLGHFALLKPLLLLNRDSGGGGFPLDFNLTVSGHPLWTGLPQHFRSQAGSHQTGTATNGGVVVATTSFLPGSGAAGPSDPPPAAIVRESAGSAGRIVHITVELPDPAVPTNDPLVQVVANSLKWSAHCL